MKRNNKVITVVLAALFMVLMGFTPLFATNMLPNFTVHDPVEEQVLETAMYLEQPTLLIFFDSSRSGGLDVGRINEMRDKYLNNNLFVAAIDLNPDPTQVFRFIAKNRPNFKILTPHKSTLINQGNSPLPLFLMLDAYLHILKREERGISPDLILTIEREIGYLR
ncbi:MAG: hypothetical protein D6B25_11710 [Desulfobulbaceae bacterium]|nr:MAG: hypothetical protein D6B25_11710 [Desulfobulbaceae bacterium]